MNQKATGEDEILRGLEYHRKQRRANAVRVEEYNEDLVPGLPNAITLDLIVPKLPWRAFHRLSSVSRCWRDVIRSRQVYDARVRSHSTETLVAFEHMINGNSRVISLYSVGDDSWHRLPQLPYCPRGIPAYYELISLDGKLYVIGGDTKGRPRRREVEGTTEVYVLDLVEQREWKR